MGVGAGFVDRDTVEVDPGQPVTGAVRVTNETGRAVALVDRLVVPPGWRVLGGEGPFSLDPGGQAVRLPTVVVPGDAEVRGYAVAYDVLDAGTGAVVATDTLRVLLVPRYGVALERDDGTAYTVSGEPFVPALIVTNMGNVRSRIVVTYTVSGPGAAAVEADTTVVLAPAERRRLDLAIATQETTNPMSVRVAATARVDEPGAGDAQRRTATTTTVLPRRDSGSLDYHRYFAQAGVSAGLVGSGFRRSSRFGAQAFASGSGRLGPESETSLTFDLRSPYVPTDADAPRYDDVYRVALDNPSYSLVAGDATYRLSLLASAFGFGVGGKVRPGGADAAVAAGAFYFDQRYGFFEDRSLGVEADLLALPRAEVGVNYLHKDGIIDGDFGSVTASAEPTSWLDVEGEVGYSENSLGLSGTSGAGRVAIGTSRVRVGGTFAEYNAGYPSLAANRQTAAVFADGSATPWLRVSASASSNESGSPLGGPRDRDSQTYRAGVDIARTAGLYYRGFRRSYVALDRTSRADQDEVEARLRGRFGRISAQARGRLGSARSSEFEDPALLYGAGASVGAQVGIWNVSANADYARGEAVSGVEVPAETFSGQASVAAQFSPSSQVLASVYATVFDAGEISSSFLVYQVDAQQRLPWGHLLGVSAGYTVSEFGGGASEGYGQFLGRYTVPFSVRTGRLQTTALISGMVVRASTGEPLGRVPVFVEAGDRVVGGAVTNARGQFFFPNLEPGAYVLYADVRGAGRQPIVVHGDALSVTAVGGEETEVLFEVVESAEIQIETSILEEREDDDTVYVDPAGEGLQVLANTALVLDDGGNEIRTYTNAAGQASFGRLRPGTYTLRMIGGQGAIEPVPGDSIVVTVGEGETASVTFQARRVRRRIRFVNDEPLVVTGRPAASAGDALPGATTHVVRPGETLASLARRYFGKTDCWRALAEANADLLSNPDVVEPGTTIRIPASLTVDGVECQRLDE